MLTHPKIVNDSKLAKIVETYKSLNKRIVFTNGCFDIIHPGHVDLLSKAKNLGDILILGLNSDESIKRLGKGEDRPINSLDERAYVLANLESVDVVIPFSEDTPLKLIKKILPNILVKGGDWSLENIVGGDVVTSSGGKVVSIELLPGYSTTNIINKIRRYS